MTFSIFISTLFGTGYFPKAPRTAGTFVAVALYFVLPYRWFENGFYIIACLLFLSILSVFFISKAEKKLGHDSGRIVLDEFLGFFFAVVFLPKTVFIVIGAFILFRFFDILKPEPVNILQKLPAGWGVIADDIMAGIYANICLQVFVRII